MNFKFRKKKKIIQREHQKSYMMMDDQDESMIDHKGIGDRKSFMALMNFASPFKKEIITSLIIMMSSSLMAIVSSKLMGNFIEDGLIKKDLKTSVTYTVIIILLEIASIWAIWFSRKSLGDSASKVIFSIRSELFKKLQCLPMNYYDRQPQGRIVTRITSDVEGIEEFFTSSLGNLLSAVMTTFFALIAMVLTDLKLGTIMVVGVIPSLVIMFFTKNLLRNSNRRVSKFSSAINAKLSEYISGIDVIRSMGLENWSMKNFDKTIDDYLRAQLKGNLLFAWSMPVVIFCASIPLIGLVWFGGIGVLKGTIGLGIFISFVRYYERFFNPMMLLSREIHVVQQAFTSTERVMSFLNENDEETVLMNHGKMKIDNLEGDIKFLDVYMSYSENNWVLKNLNFHIKSGEKIGFVGKTGCGKSSTVALLSRLYEFQQGEILIDEIPIRNFDRHHLRDRIGFVAQDAVIFRGTLRENLTSNIDLSDQDLITASKETGLVRAFTKSGFNLDMEILEGGSNLSVGERQLISLTRVLLKNPSILILDEATANIDPFYEELISSAIMKVMKKRTCLIIAHRLDTLKECDRIFVFNQGELVEEGSLLELIQRKDYFYRLHHAQSVH